MTVYSIKDWDTLFENNRSKTVKSLAWVPIPNRHDGENYSMIMLQPDAAEIFSAWILMVQVASKCSPRGSLIKGDGKPHTAMSLSVKCRAPASWFEKAISWLCANTDWLVAKEVADD